MLKKLDDQTSWNTLFLNPNSVLAAIGEKFNLKKVVLVIFFEKKSSRINNFIPYIERNSR
jgi:hypothetical protein